MYSFPRKYMKYLIIRRFSIYYVHFIFERNPEKCARPTIIVLLWVNLLWEYMLVYIIEILYRVQQNQLTNKFGLWRCFTNFYFLIISIHMC